MVGARILWIRTLLVKIKEHWISEAENFLSLEALSVHNIYTTTFQRSIRFESELINKCLIKSTD